MADLIFGGHAVAINEAEARKTKIFPSASGGAVSLVAAFLFVGSQAYADVQPVIQQSAAAQVVQPNPIKFISAAPQQVDLSLPAFHAAPQQAPQGRVPATLWSAPVDLTQVKAQFYSSPPAAIAIPNPVAGYYSVPAQAVDLTLQPFYDAPQQAAQGRVPPSIFAYPTDTTQLKAQFYYPLIAPPIIPNPVAVYFKTVPQFEERASVLVYRAAVQGSTPGLIPRVSAAPQFIDLTQQPQLFKPSATPVVVSYSIKSYFVEAQRLDQTQQPVYSRPAPATQSRVPPYSLTLPQAVDLTLQAQFTRPLPAPLVLGPLPQRFIWVPAQYDFQVNRTWLRVVFTQPFVPPVTLEPNPCQQVYLPTRPFAVQLPARPFTCTLSTRPFAVQLTYRSLEVNLPTRPLTVYWMC